MINLSEFLLARIGEEEQEVQAALDRRDVDWWYSPERMRAELAAKRQVVNTYEAMWRRAEELRIAGRHEDRETAIAIYSGIQMVIGYLATPYSDHPDFRREWLP